jgi:hypothetical protein
LLFLQKYIEKIHNKYPSIQTRPTESQHDEIKKYNDYCLSKINEILEKIDWTKYRR